MSRLLERLALVAGRRFRAVFLLFGILVVLSLFLAAGLSFDTDVLNLLPREDPVIETFRRTLRDFGGTDLLVVAVRIPPGAPVEPYEEVVSRLGRRMEELPQLDYVEYRVAEPEELVRIFMPQAFLFLDEEGRNEMARRLTAEGLTLRAEEIRRLLQTPQAPAREPILRLDPLGLAEVLLDQVRASTGALSVDLGSGYYLSRDHRLLAILAKPVEPAQNIEFDRELVAAVDAAGRAAVVGWEELVRGRDLPPPEIVQGGGYVTALDDYSLIKRDVLVNASTSLVVVLLLFLWAFRRLGPVFFAVVPLVCGVILTFGFSRIAHGSLSSATSGVAALLIGLGIDFVIVSYGRYVEERRRGSSTPTAVRRMAGTSGKAVLFGGLTSAATFYAFFVTDFVGLEQMGNLAGTGILLCMVSVLVLLPAMLVWREERHRRRETAPTLYLHAFGTARIMRWCIAAPRITLLAGLVVTAILGAAALRLEFQDSIKELRSKKNRGIRVLEEVSEHFGSGFEFMSLVVEGDDLDEVLELAHRAAEGVERLVEAGVLDGYDALATVVPPPSRQRRAASWLAEHRATGLTDSDRVIRDFRRSLAAAGLRPAGFEEGLDLLARALDAEGGSAIEALASSPETAHILERYLRRVDGKWKSVVKLFPPPLVWKREAPPEVVELAAELGPGVELTGVNVVSRHLRGKVRGQAVTAAVLGLFLVAGLLWLDFRSVADTVLSLVPLVIGVVWMLGMMGVIGLELNLMNVFVTTMILGIGVDYGIHVLHRYRELRGTAADLESGLLETGKAIALAALSTTVGFGSIALSTYPGLRSIGLVAILGALTTAGVALTLLPAWISWREGLR